jgi:hypothetical protein
MKTGFEEVQNELLANKKSPSKSIVRFHSIETDELLFLAPRRTGHIS